MCLHDVRCFCRNRYAHIVFTVLTDQFTESLHKSKYYHMLQNPHPGINMGRDHRLTTMITLCIRSVVFLRRYRPEGINANDATREPLPFTSKIGLVSPYERQGKECVTNKDFVFLIRQKITERLHCQLEVKYHAVTSLVATTRAREYCVSAATRLRVSF